MKKSFCTYLLAIMLLPMGTALGFSPAGTAVQVHYKYRLSNFSGPIPYHWAELTVDRQNNEVYALDHHENEIRIFDDHGMEIYTFGEHKELIGLRDLAVTKDGDIFVLSRKSTGTTILRCNYRGEPVGEIALKDLPPKYADLRPDRLYYRDGRLYLVNSYSLFIVIADTDGAYREGYDLRALILEQLASRRFDAKELKEIDMTGFGVDRHGNILCTVPTLFTAFRLSPDGILTAFGDAGSAPGKFGVAAGIATDDAGRIYVADRLRCVVLVFDENLNFLTEFGYRGTGQDNLIVPNDVAVGTDGSIYVAQAAYQGVSVFKVYPEWSAGEGLIKSSQSQSE